MTKEVVISVQHLTKDYGLGRGIFDLSFEVHKGEVFGFVGTNGSGKTTTIRHIMGFLKADEGQVQVQGLDSWKDGPEIKQFVSYVPGEIAFPDLSSGTVFLKNQAELLGMKNMDYANMLIDKLQLDPSANLKRMSKGMKQKTAIVAALMADKDILILDEPTTGLDPLMRETFLDIVLEEKKRGKTIFMSSQLFDELELTCDRVALILDGKIIDVADIEKLKNPTHMLYKIEFTTKEEYEKFKGLKFEIVRDQPQYFQVTIKIPNSKINSLFNVLKNYHLKFISQVKQNLERHFKEILAAKRHVKIVDSTELDKTRKERKHDKKVVKKQYKHDRAQRKERMKNKEVKNDK